ncbi:MAG: glycosyltransferase [Flavobacteriaceae bacterium]|nr:glycosyltransferase [Flavobacteriaceae bacterium]
MKRVLCVSNLVDLIIYKSFSYLKNYNYEVYITATDEEQAIKIKENNCIPIKIPHYTGKVNYKAILALRKCIKEKKIDLTYSINSSDLSNALIAGIGTKVKNIAYRGTQAKIRPTDPTYYLGILNPRVHHVVCATEDIKEKLSKHYAKNQLTYNPKPYQIDWAKDAVQNPKVIKSLPKNAFIVAHLALTKGRPHKGLRQLIEGMNLIQDSNIHLIHIGDYEEEIFRIAKNSKNSNQIHFIGKRDDAVHYLPNAHVCICPSTRDASPRSLREAMACGVACVVTDIPGARDLVQHNETGLIIKPNSPDAIAEALTHLSQHPKLVKSYGKAGTAYLQEIFSLEVYVQKFVQIFNYLST